MKHLQTFEGFSRKNVEEAIDPLFPDVLKVKKKTKITSNANNPDMEYIPAGEYRSTGEEFDGMHVYKSNGKKWFLWPEDMDTLNEETTNESLRDSSEHLDAVVNALPELEKLIFKYNKLKVKLKAKKSDTRSGIVITIFSDDLTNDLSPLGKTVFKTIQISFWGGSENQDGDIWFNPKVSYTHHGGGSNGTDFIWDSLWFNPKTNKWIEGRRL